MVNYTSSKAWSLDSVTGIVSTAPVCIHSVIVNWSSASVGLLVLSEYQAAPAGLANQILTAYTLTIGTVGMAGVLPSQQFLMGNQTFNGLVKTTMTGLQPTALIIVTGCPGNT